MAENQQTVIKRIKVYTLKDLEGILGLSNRTLATYVRSGKLKAVKIGSSWKVSEENLLKFINGEQ